MIKIKWFELLRDFFFYRWVRTKNQKHMNRYLNLSTKVHELKGL